MSRLLCSALLLALFALCATPALAAPNNDSEPTMSHVTVLLPATAPTSKMGGARFRLESYGGCFTWSTNAPQSIALVEDNTAEDTSCMGGRGSTTMLVTTVPAAGEQLGVKKTAWVWAEDVTTGRRAECEVFITTIDKLAIKTSTRVLNVGNAESLDVQAFDSAGNVFTSLEGLAFGEIGCE
jgi:nuclear pore complex protein Nup210